MGSLSLQIINPFSKFLPLILCLLPVSTISQPDFTHQLCYTNEGYYTANSTYRKNLNTLLSSSFLPSNAGINYGFYNLSAGQNPDQVYAMVLCRGDTSLYDCQSCLTNATINIIQPDFMHHLCDNEDYYIANSTYRKNLNTLLSSSSLPSNAAFNSGFYNLSVGQDPDQVYATVLCRGDTSLDDCQSCLTNATKKIIQVCPNQKHAIGVYGLCMLRYSSRPLYGVLEEAPSFYGCNVNDAANVTEFNEILGRQLQRLHTAAASSNNLRKFATGKEKMGPSDTLYALVQCSPDLSIQDCQNCLNNCVSSIQDYCAGKIGLHMIKPSCSTLFELFPFYTVTKYEITDSSAPPPVSSPGLEQFPASPPPPPLPAPTTTKSKGGDRIAKIILPIIVGTAIILMVTICIFSRGWKHKLRKNVEFEEFLRFDLAAIKTATTNFCEENKLGQGGFGVVYKGTLDNGQDIAVKRLSDGSRQGDQEFKNEVGLLAKLQHRNLVRLLGYCLDGKERLLIYEFLVSGSLDHFIYDSTKRDQLNWLRRYEIIMGIACGLLYLHKDSRLRIIHRDLKASNILLDGEMNPKISDFGLARLFETNQSEGKTSEIAGTYGYMAPEYARHGQFSVKSDVFSFGVLLLEIVSGRRNAENLLSYAWKNWSKGASANVIDPALRTRLQTEMVKCIHIGLLCVQENMADRPTMATIVHMLNSSSLSLPIPSPPAFFVESTTGSDRSSALSYRSGMSRITQSNEETLPMSRNEASIYEYQS